jgi:hypothetical protein
MENLQTFKEFLNEASKMNNFEDSRNKIIVGLKTNLLKDMKERYKHQTDRDKIHFFDDKGIHFGTLFDVGTRYQMLLHDGRLDDKGWLK